MEGKQIMSSSVFNDVDTLDGGMGHMIKRLGVSISGAQKGAIERFYNINMVNTFYSYMNDLLLFIPGYFVQNQKHHRVQLPLLFLLLHPSYSF